MAWYVVSYDLRRENSPEAWEAIYAALTTASDWCRPLLSFWILETSWAPSAVIRALLNAGVIDDDDGIVVLEITGQGDFRRVIDQDAADWLNSHITRV
jgi:hypothetical protein